MEVLTLASKFCNAVTIGQLSIRMHMIMSGPVTNAKGRAISHGSMGSLWNPSLSLSCLICGVSIL